MPYYTLYLNEENAAKLEQVIQHTKWPKSKLWVDGITAAHKKLNRLPKGEDTRRKRPRSRHTMANK